MQRTLVLTNMYPIPSKPEWGIFVKNYYDKQKGYVDVVHRLDPRILSYFNFYRKGLIGIFNSTYTDIHIHFPPLTFPFFFMLLFSRKRVTFFYHGSDLYQPTDSFFLSLFKKIYAKMVVFFGFRAILPSQNFRQHFEAVAGKCGKCEVALCWGGNNQFTRWRHSNPKRDFTIAYIGRMTEEKGALDFLRFISANAQLAKQGNTLIIGDGPLAKHVVNSIADLSIPYHYQKATGQRALADLMCRVQLVVCPSYRESFGLVVRESLLSGCAVIARPLEVYHETYNDKPAALIHYQRDFGCPMNSHQLQGISDEARHASSASI